MPARSAPARLVVATLVAAALALGCGGSTPTSPPTGGTPSGAPASADAAACIVTTPPGEQDQVPAPGEIDTRDLGGGRWRLCLAEPVAFSVEGTAWCTWTDDRTFVTEVAGLPINLSPTSTVDGGVSIERKVAYLSSNDRTAVGSWEGGPVSIVIEGSSDPGRAATKGSAAFRIPATVDQESPPPVAPPEAAGVISWQCGEAPPPRTGRV
jgi:hypothetical protein